MYTDHVSFNHPDLTVCLQQISLPPIHVAIRPKPKAQGLRTGPMHPVVMHPSDYISQAHISMPNTRLLFSSSTLTVRRLLWFTWWTAGNHHQTQSSVGATSGSLPVLARPPPHNPTAHQGRTHVRSACGLTRRAIILSWLCLPCCDVQNSTF